MGWSSSGWTIRGQRRVSSKASFNMAGGGYIEWDMDLSGAHGNVNNNFYLTYPSQPNCGISCYCDSGGSAPGCAEMDLTENNGNCWQSTTWHPNPSGSDHGGEAQEGGLAPQTHFKAEWDASGDNLNVHVGGSNHGGQGLKDLMAQHGGVIYSPQWQGWVPGGNRCGYGDLSSSMYTVKNLKIRGAVVQGPTPRLCNPPKPPSPPSPPSPPAPPSPPGCPGGSMSACMKLCPSAPAAYQACAKECAKRCSSGPTPPSPPSPPSPLPPSPPSPPPAPPTPPAPAGLTLYCPTAADMNFEYGNVNWANGGWEITGNARISSKTSFNFLGGYIEFDMDTTRAHAAVNTNIYTVSMQGDNCGKDCYCDIQDNGSPVCMELDITENNGNCKFASTWHTVPGMSGGGCDAGGCAHNGNLPGGPFHMKSTWADDGNWLTYMNNQPLHPNNYEKDVSAKDKQIVKDTMNSRGAAIESSQWTGWVPGDGCPGGGDLGSSFFSISNLRILGKVHHGPEPTKCNDATLVV